MKRALRVAVVLATTVTTFVACFSKPSEPIGDTIRDAGIDARVIDGSVIDASIDAKNIIDAAVDSPGEGGTCGSAHDDFSDMNASPCGMWGTGSNAQWMRRTVQGSLRMTMPNQGNQAQCSAPIKFSSTTGTQIEILEANAFFMGDRTYFSVDSGAQYASVQIVRSGSATMIQTTCSGVNTATSPVYDSINHRWWRLRPVGTNVVFEYGSTGASWNTLGTCAWPSIPTTVTVSFGTQAGMAGGGSAVFDDFNEHPCTPP